LGGSEKISFTAPASKSKNLKAIRLLVAAETYHVPAVTDSKAATVVEHAVCANADSGRWRVKHAATSPAVENFMVSKMYNAED
jgi:hypothetical protein